MRYFKTLTFMLVIALGLVLHLAGSALLAQAPPATNPKCVFLKQELVRAQSAPVAAPESLPAGLRASYGRYAWEATTGIFEGKLASCAKGERLGAIGRLRTIESARAKHVGKVRQEVQGSAAEAIIDSLNQLYEEEAKTFFNYEKVKFVVLDRDVQKDFSNVMDLLQQSSLDASQKAAIVKNFKFIKYEEAGRLQNSLRGIDKDAGANFPYILRGELGERADAEAKQIEKEEKARIANVKSAQLQARITLSVSMVVVVGLIGFLLFRREIVTLEIYLAMAGAAVLVGVTWILFTLGLWEWIQGYLNIAF